MDMDNIRAQGNMDGDWNPQAICRGEQTVLVIRKLLLHQKFSHGLAQTHLLFGPHGNGIDRLARFPGGTKGTGPQDLTDILGGTAHHGDFRVVDNTGTV